jgi:hypothetical protein
MPKSADADIDRRVKIVDGKKNSDRPIERVSDLRALPFVVLLGEPGIGKSTVLAKEAANEGVSVVSVRELMTRRRRPVPVCFSTRSTSIVLMAGRKTRFTRLPARWPNANRHGGD